MTGRRTLGSMSLREIEEGGLRWYENKGRMNGEDADGWEEEDPYIESLFDQEPPDFEPPPEEEA